MAHSWTELDDVKILYIVLYGYNNIVYTKSDIAQMIGISEGSLSYRIGNFKALQGIGKAKHFSKLSKFIYDKYSSFDEFRLRKVAFCS